MAVQILSHSYGGIQVLLLSYVRTLPAPNERHTTLYLQYKLAAAMYPINQTKRTRIQLGIIIPDQRQLVAINCTPDVGVVSCLFGSDSHTICKRGPTCQRYEQRRARKGISVRFRQTLCE